MSKIVPADRRSTGFQTHLERHFTPGRFRGIGYTAGLEIYATHTSVRRTRPSNAAPSRTFSGPAQRAVSCRLSNNQDHGLIII